MFILVDFGDNDFGHDIHEGLKSLRDNGYTELCPTIIKGYIVGHVVGESLKDYAIRPHSEPTAIEYAQRIYDYVSSGLRVVVDEHKPNPEEQAVFTKIDMKGATEENIVRKHFGDGAYALDCDTGYTWYIGD